MDTVNSRRDASPNRRDLHRSNICASISTPPYPERDSINQDCLQTHASLPIIYSPVQTHPEPDYSEDTTLHYAPSGDLTACMSWYNCSSSTATSIIKISLLPVVSPHFAINLCSDLPVSLSLSRPSVVILETTSRRHLLSSEQDCTSPNLMTYPSGGSADPHSMDCRKLVTPCETRNNINVTEDWGPILDSTSSVEPRSIVSYGIMGTLGRGTYGKVLLAYLKKFPDGDLYAVKLLRKTEIAPYGKQALAGELDTLQMVANVSSLDYAGEDGIRGGLFLQQLTDHFQDDTFQFIVLEYHPTTLSEPETASRFLIQEHVAGLSASISLPLAGGGCRPSSGSYGEATSALRLLAAEISLGLLFLHRNGIVHQDIKPANVMISSTGHAVIGDFGAASRLPSLDSRSSLDPGPNDHNRAIVLQPDDFITFTPLYAAPEMRQRNLKGMVIYDERADWWSLGVLLYELVTGNVPFNSSSTGYTPRRLRRSDGDHSLSFGHLEKLSISWRARGDRYVHLENFLRSLLFHNPGDRLCGHDVLIHSFFDPMQDFWSEILALKHPPCPNPPISLVDNDVSLDFSRSTYETEALQPAHADNPIQSGRYIGRSGLLDDDDEAVWGSRRCVDESESSAPSIVQAIPSTASIWFDPGVDSTVNSDTSTSNANSSTLHISMDTSELLRGSVTVDSFPTAQWASESTTQPELSNTFGQPADWSGPRFPLQLNKPVALPEKITMSLLEAMDNRDRQGIPVRFEKRQERTKKSFFGPRKLIKATVRWTWRKLHFW